MAVSFQDLPLSYRHSCITVAVSQSTWRAAIDGPRLPLSSHDHGGLIAPSCQESRNAKRCFKRSLRTYHHNNDFRTGPFRRCAVHAAPPARLKHTFTGAHPRP